MENCSNCIYVRMDQSRGISYCAITSGYCHYDGNVNDNPFPKLVPDEGNCPGFVSKNAIGEIN